MSIRTLILLLAFVAGSALTLAFLAGWMPIPAWAVGPFGGAVLYGVAALTVFLAFLIVWT